MKAWVLRSFGNLELAEIPLPRLQAGWTRIAVSVVQPSITEVTLVSGLSTRGLDLFRERTQQGQVLVPGHEFAGHVVQSGRYAPGLRVTSRAEGACGSCGLCRAGHQDRCIQGPILGFGIWGAFAEYVDVPDQRVIVASDERLTDEVLAATQPLTDAVAAVAVSRLELGATVAVIGLGSMGLGCLAASAVSGAGRIIGIGRRDGPLAAAREFGASHLIDVRQTEPVEAVMELTDGIGADVVFECAGGSLAVGLAGQQSLQQALSMVGQGGTVVQVALHDQPVPMDTVKLRSRHLRYVIPDEITDVLARHTLHLVASGLIKLDRLLSHPLVGIEQLGEALTQTREKARLGLLGPVQVKIRSAN